MKPCPFCGNKYLKTIKLMSNNGKVIVGWQVTCEPDEYPCGAEGPIEPSKNKAEKKWNKRCTK